MLLERTSEEVLLGEPKKITVVFKPDGCVSELAKQEVELRLRDILKATIKALLMGEKWQDALYVIIGKSSKLEVLVTLEESYWEDEEELVLVYRVQECEYHYDEPVFNFDRFPVL